MLLVMCFKQLFRSEKAIPPLVGIVLMLLVSKNMHAQSPSWTVNAGNFQYSMNIVAFLHVDSELLQSEADRVAAFVGGEVRGVTSPIYVPSSGRYLAYLTVFANKQGETLTFKLYESSSGKVVDVDATVKFEIDGQLGNVFQAFSLATPALSNEAEITNFFFTGADSVSTVISAGKIDIVLEYDQDLSVLTPQFTTSEGASVYLDRILLESGVNTFDFSEPVAYTVLSEDESVKNTYTVTVTNRKTTAEGFACTNVITPNNDGSNDHWIVQDAFKYERHNFRILDANGRVLFESTGYQNDWDGTFNGSKVARGKYYYVVRDPDTNAVFRGDILVLY
jgi:gliding motility-associated-like protein